MHDAVLSPDGRTISVKLPMRFQRRGGRKMVVVPETARASQPGTTSEQDAVLKALVRAYRWQRMLDSGRFVSVTELAEAEKIHLSYMGRVLRITLLAPDLVEAILDGRQPERMTLARLVKAFPLEWEEQRRYFGASS